MPKKWQEEAIKKNIFFASFSNDNFELVMRFVNKMALEENVLKDQREYLLLIHWYFLMFHPQGLGLSWNIDIIGF